MPAAHHVEDDRDHHAQRNEQPAQTQVASPRELFGNRPAAPRLTQLTSYSVSQYLRQVASGTAVLWMSVHDQ